jgi:hypothetical protein
MRSLRLFRHHTRCLTRIEKEKKGKEMTLVIRIPLDGNDLEQTDLEVLVEESKEALGINIEVGRSQSEEESHIIRQSSISAEYFTATIEP